MIKRILIFTLFSSANFSQASDITVGESCVVNSATAMCSTPIDVFNNSGKNACLWRKPENGKPATIFGCKSPATANWSDSWDQSSINGDEIELRSHIGWPSHDQVGYDSGTLLDSETVVAEYGKMTLPQECIIPTVSDTCYTEITVEKYGPKKLCLWRATSGQSPLVFGCISSPQTAWKRNWTQTSYNGDIIELRAHDTWPANDPQAYQNSLLLDSELVKAQLEQPDPNAATISSVNTSCAHNYCITIRGNDFAVDASVLVRPNSPNSIAEEFSGNDIYTRWFTESEDKLFFPIQDLNLQSELNGQGLCFKIKNNNIESNEMCTTRPPTAAIHPYMGEVVQSYTGHGTQDLEHTSYFVKGDASPLQGGDKLKILGNSWKKIFYNYNVTANTVLEFEFHSNEQEPEISGIGFVLSGETSVRLNTHMWQIHGTQTNFGIQDYHNYTGTAKKSYSIPIGQYFTGQVSEMVFIADEDNHVGQSTIFTSPRLVDYGDIAGDLLVADDSTISGWACMSGNEDQVLEVDIYSTHAFSDDCKIIDNTQVCLIGSTFTQPSGGLNNCGTNGQNDFSMETPSVIKNGGNHKIYAQVQSTNLTGNLNYSFYTLGISPYWDSGMSEKCVKRIGGDDVNGFQDLSGCTDPDNHYYSLALQAEVGYGDRCIVNGNPHGASVVGQGQGPFQFYWKDQKDGLSANLISDLVNFPHSCENGDDVWNWFVFTLTSEEAGGLFPNAHKAGAHFSIKTDYELLASGTNTRVLAVCEAWWNGTGLDNNGDNIIDGKDGSGHSVVVNFIRTNQADNVPDDPQVVVIHPSDGSEIKYVNYLGSQLGFQEPQKQIEKDYFVNCGSLFKHAVERGYLLAPKNDQQEVDWNKSRLTKFYVGHELHNTTKQNAGTTSLELKNYRVVEIND